MSVYNSNGSGGVHVDKSISGKKATQPAKKVAKVAEKVESKKKGK